MVQPIDICAPSGIEKVCQSPVPHFLARHNTESTETGPTVGDSALCCQLHWTMFAFISLEFSLILHHLTTS